MVGAAVGKVPKQALPLCATGIDDRLALAGKHGGNIQAAQFFFIFGCDLASGQLQDRRKIIELAHHSVKPTARGNPRPRHHHRHTDTTFLGACFPKFQRIVV